MQVNPNGGHIADHSNGHVDGINCDVNNCYYNDSHLCTADGIKVGPQYAASVADTVCATFRPR